MSLRSRSVSLPPLSLDSRSRVGGGESGGETSQSALGQQPSSLTKTVGVDERFFRSCGRPSGRANSRAVGMTAACGLQLSGGGCVRAAVGAAQSEPHSTLFAKFERLLCT